MDDKKNYSKTFLQMIGPVISLNKIKLILVQIAFEPNQLMRLFNYRNIRNISLKEHTQMRGSQEDLFQDNH